MQCPQCQHVNRETAKFCEACGARLSTACFRCGHDVSQRAQFCEACGTRLTTSASAADQPFHQNAVTASRLYAALPFVIALLQREHRVSYEMLQQAFGPGNGLPEAIMKELTFKQFAADENGEGLVWLDESMVIPEPAPHIPEAERRQLTVMFCDLVGSTDLSTRLDPEDLREVIRAYQETAAGVIARYGGHIAQYLGDGLLIYFGFPVARERDAERAVYSGLGIAEAIVALNDQLKAESGLQLAVRIGIHTGPVVVGEMGGGGRHENLALGETPNIAARLEGLAQPNTVVISPVTAQLVQRSFALEDLGLRELKGVAEPMPLYAVVGPREFNHDDRNAGQLTEFDSLVGRDEEIGLLLRRWQQSKDGFGQVVLISGEAGIGKSGLVEGLRHHINTEGLSCIAFRCSPYHTNSALYPIIDAVQHALSWQPGDSVDTKLAKLEQAFNGTCITQEEAVPLLAGLLSLPPPEGHYPALTLNPRQQRQQTLDVLTAWWLEGADRQPVLAVWEDLHWADPSTLEALAVFIEQTPTAAMLHVLTSRPEFEPPWPAWSHVTPLRLNRLERPQVETLIKQLVQGKVLPREVVQHIVAKTDGVPLYIEELTKMLLGSALLQAEADHYVLTGPLQSVAIPDTLQDSLMERLDQLGKAKELAQLGAVMGREFSYEMLQALSPQAEETIQSDLAQLVESELLYQRGRPPRATYIFKHALIQDAAYASLLRRTRQQVHRQIAQLLEARFAEVVETQPELVAHHYTEADLAEQAIGYWYQAGQRASERSAYVEASHHLSQGLELLGTLPRTAESDHRELLLQLTLGNVLTVTKGHAAPEAGYAFKRARELCEHTEDTQRLFPVLRGLWEFYEVSGELQAAYELGEQLLTLAQDAQEPVHLVVAHDVLGDTSFWRGEFIASHTHAEQAIALYDPSLHHTLDAVYGAYDAGVISHCFAAFSLGYLGYAEQARQRMQAGLVLAQALSHPYSLAYAMMMAVGLRLMHRDRHGVLEQVETAQALCLEQEFAFLQSFGTIMRGQVLVTLGREAEGIGCIEKGLEAWRTMGAEGWQPAHLGALAEAYGRDGRPEAGLKCISEALARVSASGERFYEAELRRLQGELTLALAACDEKEAEACFHQALDVARRQQAKLLELRTSVSLARLWQSQGKGGEAHQLLMPIYNYFTEGFDTIDLQEAKCLLDDLK